VKQVSLSVNLDYFHLSACKHYSTKILMLSAREIEPPLFGSHFLDVVSLHHDPMSTDLPGKKKVSPKTTWFSPSHTKQQATAEI